MRGRGERPLFPSWRAAQSETERNAKRGAAAVPLMYQGNRDRSPLRRALPSWAMRGGGERPLTPSCEMPPLSQGVGGAALGMFLRIERKPADFRSIPFIRVTVQVWFYENTTGGGIKKMEMGI